MPKWRQNQSKHLSLLIALIRIPTYNIKIQLFLKSLDLMCPDFFKNGLFFVLSEQFFYLKSVKNRLHIEGKAVYTVHCFV